VAVISLSGTVVSAQQEVDPDHFDVSAAQARKAPTTPHGKQAKANATVAKKGRTSAKHHHVRNAA